MHNLYGQERRATKLLKINCSESSCGSLQETDIFMSIMYLIDVWFYSVSWPRGHEVQSLLLIIEITFIKHAGELLIFDQW